MKKLALFFFLPLAVVGCQSAVKELCEDEMISLGEELAWARNELPLPGLDDRSLAANGSVKEGETAEKVVEEVALTEKQTKEFRDWSKRQLASVQYALTRLEFEPSLHYLVQDDLNLSANDLVQIYGYADLGDGTTVSLLVRRISGRFDRVKGLVCGGP